jgi:1-acyl-sn-glycerol-3-phosphate acyltransferase
MSVHLSSDIEKALEANEKIVFAVPESNKSRFSGKLRYWWGWTVASLLLLFVGLPMLVVLGIINRRMWLYPIARWGAGLWMAACGAEVRAKGLENLEPGRQYVFIANHRSYLDTATLFFYAGRKMGLVAKKELLKAPVLGQGMHYVNIIAIDRSNPERALRSMDRAREVISAGYSFGVFAEGTRAMPGELLPFKKGAFHLALQVGTPIIPVAIKNTDMMMGKRTGVAYPGVVEITMLPPVETAEASEKDVPRLLKQTRSAIARELAK